MRELTEKETLNNVSSTNSEQRKLCVKSPIENDARFLRKQAISCNGT